MTKSTPAWREQLGRYRDGLGALGTGLPLGLLLVFLRCWTRLDGTLSLEVFGHLGFALDDAEPMFELMLAVRPRRQPFGRLASS